MHSVNGNMGKPFKGKGKAQNKGSSSVQEKEEMFLEEVRSALPEAAKQRTVPTLIQNEWDATVRPYTELDSVGGVSIVPKEMIPDVLHTVGYTLAPTAMLTTQPPAELGLKGYPSTHLACTINVRDDDGQIKELLVQRHLIQIGFGAHVHKVHQGC